MKIKLILAFAAVYIIWGSTYLAIRFAIETLPPFLMAGIRFLVAGGGLYFVMRWRGVPTPSRREWRDMTIIGAFLFLGGNGGVVWAEQYVPSGLTSLLIATVSLWMVLLDWLWKGNQRPRLQAFLGIGLGLFGIALLVDPFNLGGERIHVAGAVMVLASAVSWAVGSIFARTARISSSVFMTSAVEMIGGGALLLLAGSFTGEWRGIQIEAISSASVFAFIYLVLIGSIIGITSYAYILQEVTADKASTYAFVNPVVAVFLGWLLADESVDGKIVAATMIIIFAVMLVIREKKQDR
ncbi:MAG: EamA family transporter [Deferribacteres bacterium]|nr:EamA family transporter [candidate division KSB1 bacterium]MCB9503319.1 EamA family transporter [Deferribacteres bacterium]